MKNRLLFLLVAFLFTGLSASAQTWLWGQQGIGGLKAAQLVGNIATDKTGNVYEAGTYQNSAIFGTDTLISHSEGDLFLVKYDQNGNALWAITSGGFGNLAVGLSVAADDSDNAYVTGFAYNDDSVSALDTLVFGADTLYTPAGGGMFLVKYNAAGKLMWAKQPGSLVDSNAAGWAVTTDNFGHEYVTGNGAFLIKYDRNGNVIWNVLPQSNNNFLYSATGYSVATDGYGNSYITGAFVDTLIFGVYKLYYKGDSTTLGNLFIAKFDSNGNVLWAHQSTDASVNYDYFNNGSGNSAYSVTANRAGSAYVTGFFSGTMTIGDYTFSTTDKSNAFINNFFIVKYNPDGTIAWGEQADPYDNSSWGSFSICSDDSGHIFLSGAADQRSGQGTFSFALGSYMVTINNPENYGASSFLLKLDSMGNVLCGSTLTDGGEQPDLTTSDPTGKFVYLGGVFVDSFSIGKNYLIDNMGSAFESYLARWQPCINCDLVALSSPPSSTICAGQSVTLTASGGTSYTWSPANGLSATIGSSVVAAPLTNVTYTVSVSDSAGCSAKALDTITVSIPPDKPTISQSGDTLTSSATQGNQWLRNDTVLTGATNQTYILTISGEYKVIAENPANGCSSTSETGYYTPTGVNQLSVNSNQLSVYPNPTSGEVFITINPSAMDVTDWNLQVTDVLGRTVYFKQNLNYNNEIDLFNLPGSVYFICVMTKAGQTVVPVVKQ